MAPARFLVLVACPLHRRPRVVSMLLWTQMLTWERRRQDSEEPKPAAGNWFQFVPLARRIRPSAEDRKDIFIFWLIKTDASAKASLVFHVVSMVTLQQLQEPGCVLVAGLSNGCNVRAPAFPVCLSRQKTVVHLFPVRWSSLSGTFGSQPPELPRLSSFLK